MTPEQIDRVFGRGRLKIPTGPHVEVFREAAADNERRRYTKRFLTTDDGDYAEWTEREWRMLARLIGHGSRCVPRVVQYDGDARGVRRVQTYDAGATVDQWATLIAVERDAQADPGSAVPHAAAPATEVTRARGHVFEDCAHWWALAHHCLIALGEIHALGLVHLDVKGDNVCIPIGPADFDPDVPGTQLRPVFRELALIDFAFSIVTGEPLATALPIGRQEDYDYQSPRLLAALEAGRDGDLRPTESLDWRCDLYSLAAMLARYLPGGSGEREVGGGDVRVRAPANGWTAERHDAANALIHRIREAHDRDLPARLPHAELIAHTSARLAEDPLAESLQRGWTLRRGWTPAAVPPLPATPVTRLAPPVRVVAPPIRVVIPPRDEPFARERGPRAAPARSRFGPSFARGTAVAHAPSTAEPIRRPDSHVPAREPIGRAEPAATGPVESADSTLERIGPPASAAVAGPAADHTPERIGRIEPRDAPRQRRAGAAVAGAAAVALVAIAVLAVAFAPESSLGERWRSATQQVRDASGALSAAADRWLGRTPDPGTGEAGDRAPARSLVADAASPREPAAEADGERTTSAERATGAERPASAERARSAERATNAERATSTQPAPSAEPTASARRPSEPPQPAVATSAASTRAATPSAGETLALPAVTPGARARSAAETSRDQTGATRRAAETAPAPSTSGVPAPTHAGGAPARSGIVAGGSREPTPGTRAPATAPATPPATPRSPLPAALPGDSQKTRASEATTRLVREYASLGGSRLAPSGSPLPAQAPPAPPPAPATTAGMSAQSPAAVTAAGSSAPPREPAHGPTLAPGATPPVATTPAVPALPTSPSPSGPAVALASPPSLARVPSSGQDGGYDLSPQGFPAVPPGAPAQEKSIANLSRPTPSPPFAAPRDPGPPIGSRDSVPPAAARDPVPRASAREPGSSTYDTQRPRASVPDVRTDDDYREQGRRALSDIVPRTAMEYQPQIERVLALAASAQHPGLEPAIVDAASAPGQPVDALVTMWDVVPDAARRLSEEARRAYWYRRDVRAALDLQLRAFGADPGDPEVAGDLAFFYLVGAPERPEVARQLSVHAIGMRNVRHEAGRRADWTTLAIASALTGRYHDARDALYTSAALTRDTDRVCREVLAALSVHGERLREPVEALLRRLQAQGRTARSPNCAWPPTYVSRYRQIP